MESRKGGAHDLGKYFSTYLDLWVRDEALGFKGIFFSEHHYGNSFSPSPNLLIATVAQQTKSLRLGVMGVVTPFYVPTRIVEEIGMLDQLTGGRLEIGTAIGVPQELERIGLSMKEARERNDEALEILDMALNGETVTFRGKYFACENLRLMPPPRQSPAPPKWTTIVSTDSARKTARRKSKVCTGFNSALRIKEIFDAYRDEADVCGLRIGPADLALRRRVVVAESQSQAAEMAAGVTERMREMVAKDPRAIDGTKTAAPGATKAVPDAPGGGFVMGADEFISGTPAQVTEQIVEQCRLIGAGTFLAVLHWGASIEEVSHGHELFGRDVLPRLKSAKI